MQESALLRKVEKNKRKILLLWFIIIKIMEMEIETYI